MSRDPIIIDPPGFDQAEVWKGCNEAAANLTYPDGEINWRNAFAADPGVCSCPACDEYYWNLGRVQKCAECGFEYPTDAWPMYSWGVQAARNIKLFSHNHERRMSHPYYRYGFEHPTEDTWQEFKRIPWREVLEPSK